MKLRLPTILLLIWLCLTCHGVAQINVSLHLPRTSFLLNEPTVATITISNLAGQDLLFEDSPDFGPWCRLELKALRGDFVSPRREEISFPPLIVPSGKTISRTINVSDFFFLDHPGQYKIRVGVFFAPTRAEFYTQSTFNADPGRMEWAQQLQRKSLTSGAVDSDVVPGALGKTGKGGKGKKGKGKGKGKGKRDSSRDSTEPPHI
jgi:hypothetical protein